MSKTYRTINLGDFYCFTVIRDLKTTSYCNAETKKGFWAFWSLTQPFKHFDEETFRSSYPTHLRPHLEFCIQVVSSCLVKDTNTLRHVLCVKRLTKRLFKLPNYDPFKQLNLFSLSKHRTWSDLILVFRIFSNDLGVKMTGLLPLFRTNHLRGNRNKGSETTIS